MASRPNRARLLIASLAAVSLVAAVLLAPAIGASDPGAVVAKKKKGKAGRNKPISGKLNKSGYTVIALSDASTNASAVKVTGHKFKVPIPLSPGKTKAAPAITLHLRAPDGTYAGPIVLAGKSAKAKKSKAKKNRVIVGVKPGGSLGAIKIDPAKGFARTKKMPAKSAVDSRRVAQATKGVPIGNGLNVGLVRSSVTGPSTDLDLDGVPNSLDVDDNGNVVLDGLDPASKPVSASRAAHRSLNTPHPSAFMGLGTQVIGDTLNAYGSTDAEIAAALPTQLWLSVQWGGVDPGSAELDCGTLSYCSLGGTGRKFAPGDPSYAHSVGFPRPCCDPVDGNGLGSLVDTAPTSNDFHGMSLFPSTTPDRIHPGDVLIMRATRDGAQVSPVSTMGTIFSTFPAVARYDDQQGDSGTLSYPFDNAVTTIPVHADVSGDVVVSLTFWRPQRLRIATEPGTGKWMDVGHMSHFAQAGNVSGPPPAPGTPFGTCPSSSYSTTDPNLSPQPANPLLGAFHFDDREGDQPTPPPTDLTDHPDLRFANTLSYTLNLTDCLAAYGLSFNVSESRSFSFWAMSGRSSGQPSNAQSLVSFTRTP